MPRSQRKVPAWVAVGGVLFVAGQLALIDWAVYPGSSRSPATSATSGSPNHASGSLSVAGAASSGEGRTPFSAGGRSGGRGVTGGSSSSGASVGIGVVVESPGGAGSAGSASASGASSPFLAARQAVSSYVTALVHRDSHTVAAESDDGPLAVAAVLLDEAAVNDGRGATTTMTSGPMSFTVAQSDISSVTFAGSVAVTTSIVGPQGNGTFTDTISGPVKVTHESTGWKVTDFRYDDLPVQWWPEEQTQTVSGVVVDLGFLVSYGNVTAALIGVAAETGAVGVQLQAVTLAAGSTSEAGVGDFTGPPTPTGILRFSRLSSAPSTLAIDFSSSSGQRYDYLFTLS